MKKGLRLCLQAGSLHHNSCSEEKEIQVEGGILGLMGKGRLRLALVW
jgi:hypothetical protein